MGSMSKRIFDLACLAKKLDFQTVFSLFWKCTFKINFFQSSQGVVQIYCYYKSKFPYITGIQFSKFFWPSLLRKKLDFQAVFSLFCKMYFWNIFFFKLVKELLKSFVTTNQSSPISMGSKSKRIFDLACLGKKRFSNGFFVVLRNAFLKYIFFKLVKESIKSIVTTNQSSPISLGSKSKRICVLACLGKKLDFHMVFSLFCKMYF